MTEMRHCKLKYCIQQAIEKKIKTEKKSKLKKLHFFCFLIAEERVSDLLLFCKENEIAKKCDFTFFPL